MPGKGKGKGLSRKPAKGSRGKSSHAHGKTVSEIAKSGSGKGHGKTVSAAARKRAR